MNFALCSQKEALRSFSGPWGEKGFPFAVIGNINYNTVKTYYIHYKDYQKGGETRWGIKTLLRHFPSLGKSERLARSRQLLKDMLRQYHKYLPSYYRSSRSRKRGRILHEKEFCTNIIAGMGSFKRAVPGDLFGYARIRKDFPTNKNVTAKFGFQHWGIITGPSTGQVLHNQTPGGMWNRKFSRWGIQYGNYRRSKLNQAWKYKQRRGYYQKRVFFVNRLNLHYFIYAYLQKAEIYTTSNPSLCRDWIDKHADVYFTNLAKSTPSRAVASLP